MKINFKKGFSIAEIVVVVGIMALLTTLVYTSLDGSKKQSRDQKRVADISAVQLALEQFYARNKYYPNSLSDPKFVAYLPSVPSGVMYAPLNQNPPENEKCSTYHLWITLESKISILDSKKGFDSSGLSSHKCGSYNSSFLINASSSPLVYDITP
jgi:type II secretory pathway pseudopilin PulG